MNPGPRRHIDSPASLRRAGAILGLGLAALTVLLTWPLFRHPATRVLDAASLYGGAAPLVQRDINLTMWVLAWDAHALVTAPHRLFHANAMWPAPYTLALSEHMLGNVPFFAPVYLATGNPVLAHQATLLASFVVAGLAMAAWVLYRTGDRGAAAAAGILFAFAPYRTWQIGNLHVIAIQWLPLVLLGIDATLDRRARAIGPAVLFAGLTLSTACSYYVGYAAFVLAAVYLGAGAIPRGRAGLAASLPVLVALVGAAAVLALPSLPYLRAQALGIVADHRRQGFVSLAFVRAAFDGVSGTLGRYFWPRRDGIPLYLGLLPLALAAAGAALHRGPPRIALLLVAASGFILSLGPSAATAFGTVPLPYRLLAEVVPGFSAMRAPQRFGALVTLAVAGLAGLGLAALRARLRARGRPRLARALALAAVAGLCLEVRPRGLATTTMPTGAAVHPVYRWLAAHGEGGAVVELPMARDQLYRHSLAMYHSIFHWLPIANGYSPYPPPSFRAAFAAAERLPDPAALRELFAHAPVRWLVVHRSWIEPATWAAWRATLESELRLVRDFGEVLLFERAPENRRRAPRIGGPGPRQ